MRPPTVTPSPCYWIVTKMTRTNGLTVVRKNLKPTLTDLQIVDLKYVTLTLTNGSMVDRKSVNLTSAN